MKELWRNWTFPPSTMYVALRAVMAENPALYRYIILNVINTFMEELCHTESSAVNFDQNLPHTVTSYPLLLQTDIQLEISLNIQKYCTSMKSNRSQRAAADLKITELNY